MLINIVARTRMRGSRLCVGGMSDDGGGFRLMTANCEYHGAECRYQVGETWEMEVKACANLEAPHLEDVAVLRATLIGRTPNLQQLVSDRGLVWTGRINRIFNGKIRFTRGGSGYISQAAGLPPSSTGFWISDTDLVFSNEPRQAYMPRGDRRYLSYVGTIRDNSSSFAGEMVAAGGCGP
jgi:hypothetical protein